MYYLVDVTVLILLLLLGFVLQLAKTLNKNLKQNKYFLNTAGKDANNPNTVLKSFSSELVLF